MNSVDALCQVCGKPARWLPLTAPVCPLCREGNLNSPGRQGEPGADENIADPDGKDHPDQEESAPSRSPIKQMLARCSSWNEARKFLRMIRDRGWLSRQELAQVAKWAAFLHTVRSEDLRAR